MTMPTQHRWRRQLAAIALALTITTLAACSGTGHNNYGERDDNGTGIPSGATTQTLPPLPYPWTQLDRTNPQTVALAAVNALFDWQPATGDTSPDNARDRARPLLTPRAADTYQPYPIPRPLWQSWMNTHATITATSEISSEQHPTDTPGTWHRKITTRIHTPQTDLTATTLITATKQPVWTITAATTLPT